MTMEKRGFLVTCTVSFFLKMNCDWSQTECSLFFVTIVLPVIALCYCAGVAEFRGCSAANGGRGLGASCSWKQHAARVGQPGHWRSASSGEVNINFSLISNPH